MSTEQPIQELHIDAIELRKAALVYRSINHTLRQQMLRLIHEKGKITVTELYIKLRLEQSVASQHLAILRRSALVIAERRAKNIFYAVNYSRLDQLHTFTAYLLNN